MSVKLWGGRSVAVLLGVALSLALRTGCDVQETLPLPSKEPSPQTLGEYAQEYARDRSPVHFSELVYVRPDLEEMTAQIRELTRGIRQSSSAEEALEHMKQARDLLLEYDTMYVLSEIHYDAGWDDDLYEEWAFCDDGYYTYNNLWDDVYSALQRSDYADQLLPLWDSSHSDDGHPISANSNKSGALLRQLDDAADEALDILYYATVPYGSRELTLNEIMQDPHWLHASKVWYEAHGEALLEQYTAMVRAGTEMARDYYRYDDYAAYLFVDYGRDYTPDMARTLVQEIETHILPLDSALEEAGFWWGAWDEYTTFEELIDMARRVLPEMNPQMLDALDLMLEYELYYVGLGDNQEPRPYVHYLPTPGVPFLFCPFYGGLYDVVSLTHEFGHFYEVYLNMDNNCGPDDLAEVHSQTMSLLFAQKQRTLDGQEELLEFAVADTVDALTYQVFNAAIELEVLALPLEEMTAQRIGQIGYEKSRLFGLGEEDELLARYEWLTDSELFTDPLQPLCYSTSAAVALDLWRVSLEDMDGALEQYDTLVHHQGDFRLLANAEAAGLESPFRSGWGEEMAAFLRAFLLEDVQESAA